MKKAILNIYNRIGCGYVVINPWYDLKIKSHTNKSVTYEVYFKEKDSVSVFFNYIDIAREMGLKCFISYKP